MKGKKNQTYIMIYKTCNGTQSGIDGYTQHPLATGPNPFMLLHHTQTHTDSPTHTHLVVDLIFLE